MEKFIEWRRNSDGKCTLKELYAWFGCIPKTAETGKRKRYDFECNVKGCTFTIETIRDQHDASRAMMHSCDRLAHILQLVYDDSYGNLRIRQLVRNFVFYGFKSPSAQTYYDSLVENIISTSKSLPSLANESLSESYSSSDDESSDDDTEPDFELEAELPSPKRSKPLFATYLPLVTLDDLFPQLEHNKEI
ncbi:MAG: hypothetical protein CMP20_10310 [Rickettsiales bacterium]|nr:hypothetical protein [Rickettsiales bacterium]